MRARLSNSTSLPPETEFNRNRPRLELFVNSIAYDVEPTYLWRRNAIVCEYLYAQMYKTNKNTMDAESLT